MKATITSFNTVEKVSKGYEYSKEKVDQSIDDYKKSKEPLSDKNWYSKAANTLEELNDSMLR